MILTVIFISSVLVLYSYSTRTFKYWQNKGIKYIKPIPFFGTYIKSYLLQQSITQRVTEDYWKYPGERVVGVFRSTTPELLIRDPEIAKRVLITDFSYFCCRNVFPTDNEPLMRQLFNLNGDKWRLLRQRLTPAFTSGKLRAMFPLIVERAERLHTRIQASAAAPIDARDLMARFSTDFIGACAFGLNMDALSDEKSKFRALGVKYFDVPPFLTLKLLLKQVFPKTLKNVRFTERIEADIISLVRVVLQERNHEPSGRNDFIDLLLECRKKGKIVDDSKEKFKPDGTPEEVVLEMTDDLLAAQVFIFFVAGFETSSSTSSYTLHLLAYHPEIQKKVQEEIDSVLAQHDNKLCYDTVKEMTYLEWAFKESMRIFPSAGFLNRECVRKYRFSDLDLTIDKRVKILIPVEAMQNDPKYFENPKEFRPERFDPKELDVAKTKYAYLPFGDGPRACIAERLGLMQSLAGLAAVLAKFSVEPGPTSIRHPQVKPSPGVVQIIKGGLPLMFLARKKELNE